MMKNHKPDGKRRMSVAYIMISNANDTDKHLGGLKDSSSRDPGSGSTFFLIIQFRGMIKFPHLLKECSILSMSLLFQEFQLQSGNQEVRTYQQHADFLLQDCNDIIPSDL